MTPKTTADCFAQMIGVPMQQDGETDEAFHVRIMEALIVDSRTPAEKLRSDAWQLFENICERLGVVRLLDWIERKLK